MDKMRQDYPIYDFSFLVNAKSGHGTWSNLVRQDGLSGRSLVVMDIAGLDEAAELEAFIRKAWSAGQRVVVLVTPSWNNYQNDAEVNTPANQAVIVSAMSLLDVYGVPYVNFWAMVQAHVAGGGHISDWFADSVHPSTAGYTQAANALAVYLPNGGAIGVLPSRQYVNTQDFERAPIRIVGTGYNSRAGTWADNGTSTSSSTAGSTITFTGTFRWYGCYRTDGGTNTVEISLDGGSFVSTPFRQYPVDTGTFAAHTVTIRIPTGGNAAIDEFWAI